MRKRNLAMWPLLLMPKRARKILGIVPPLEELWMQEQERLKIEIAREPEMAREKIDRLLMGSEIRKLIL